MSERSQTFQVRVRGDIACFTRPEFKVERVSYEVMTPSAARGVMEAVLWKPAIQWVVESITVLAPIRWTSFRRNEVNSVASARQGVVFCADEDRAQRNTVALRDVDYGIEVHFRMTDRAGDQDNVTKFEEMFQRRLSKGQRFHQPYLGCREFPAVVEPWDGSRPAVPTERRPLGFVFWDFDYRQSPPKPTFFEAWLENGVVSVPSPDVVLAQSEAGGPS
ncbi:MAG: type I-C CRISPR-associated protein Cas5 [Myxococcales bacterium]|nr:type I-C CRISPR-associated protein Cas5 [Myxococcales bacterium]